MIAVEGMRIVFIYLHAYYVQFLIIYTGTTKLKYILKSKI